ncbi:MAG TPA: endo-1,4-beta-xylanase [Tepidisphaeraceae bacterium]|nr:endo-1,4-beta-xylanase [Tepidisphaeraceae bacterium]
MLVFLSLDVVAVRSRKLPSISGSIVLTDESLESFRLMGRQRELATSHVLNGTGKPFSKVLRVSTVSAARSEWNVQLVAAIDSSVKTGDVLLARFWMRCIGSMTGEGFVTFVYEIASPEFDKAAEARLGAGTQWTECCIPFRAARDFPAGGTQVCFRVGYDRQTIEIASIQIVNYGNGATLEDLPRARVSYGGRNRDAAWRRAALTRIDRHRKADLTIKVVDSSGRSVPNAKVRVELKRHAFRFGSCVAVDHLLDPSPDGDEYRNVVEKNFNCAVFENEMKWQALDSGISPRLDQALQWLRSRNIQVRGHNLVWPGWKWLPPKLRQYANQPDQLRQITARHITDVVSHFRGKLIQWDVVNEPYTNFDLINLLGGRDVLLDWYKLARQADPKCKLHLNDYGILEGGPDGAHSQDFYSNIKFLKDHGLVDGIGIQSHFAAALPSPMQVLATLDRFSELMLPIELTELSLNIDDPDLQADFMRDFLIAVFSHPNVHGLMLWGFWEQRHWRPQGALWNADWSIRPHGQAWMDLVHREWNTQIQSSTNDEGTVSVRGFLGEYDIVVCVDRKTTSECVELTSAGRCITLMMP